MAEKTTVAIVYGFSEGRYHSRKLRHALRSAGYDIISDSRSADIVIAHSAGCYLVPVDHEAKIVLNIGYTFWPGRPLLGALRMKLSEELHRTGLFRWLRECIVHDFYALNLPYVLRLARGWQAPEKYLATMQGQNIFIRNSSDPYCEPAAILRASNMQHTYLSMPGYHDHLWDTPEPYVSLLKSIAWRET